MIDQLINGIVLGNIYALVAVGITQIYGVTGIVNFAHGSIYMVGAYVGWMAVAWYDLPLPVATVVVLFASAVLGMAVEWVAVRPFAQSSRSVLLLTTIAVALILDQAAQLVWGPQTQAFHSPLPPWRLQIGGGTIGLLDLLIIAVGAGAAVFLHVFLTRTRLGQAVRATAQDREAALQMGVATSAVSRLSFAMAGAFAGLSGLLVGLYYHNIHPTMGFSASLKGFVAALLGGLGFIPGAIGGAYLLGITEAFGVATFGSSYRDLVAVALLLGVLLFRPSGLFTRKRALPPEPMTGTFLAVGRPLAVPRWAWLVLVIAAATLPFWLGSSYWLQVLALAWAFGIVAVSLNLLAGTTGQTSLGQAGFVAIGAYASAILTSRLQWPFGLALLVSPMIAAALGVLMCYPALRLRGQYLSIATLSIGQAVPLIALNWTGLTRGALGISNIQPPIVFGYEIVSAKSLYWLALVLLLATVWVLQRLSGSHIGRALRSVREDEVAARAYGIRPERYKAIAFGVSAFFAAVAGVLLAHVYTYLAPDTFTHALSIQLVTMVILGGLDNMAGVAIGAALLITLPESARFLSDYRFLLYGLLLLLMLRFRPQGLLNRAA